MHIVFSLLLHFFKTNVLEVIYVGQLFNKEAVMPLLTIRHVISMPLKDPRFVRYAYATASMVEKTAATPPQVKEPEMEIPKELVLILPLRVSDELRPTLTDFKGPYLYTGASSKRSVPFKSLFVLLSFYVFNALLRAL